MPCCPKNANGSLFSTMTPWDLLDLEFVVRAFADAGQENLPDAAAEQLAHRIAAAVPAVEIADHADALRIRRPDVESSCRRTPPLSVRCAPSFS